MDPASLFIVTYPDPVLTRRADPIDSIDDTVRAVAAQMLELMAEAEGLGLAAPQVGLSWRMFVTRAQEGHPDRVYVNPRLSNLGAEREAHEEGCLSLPGITGEVRRPTSVTITALDLEGNEFTLSSDGFIARVWQHEYDHVDGVLIIDKMSRLDRLAIRKTLRQLQDSRG